MAKDKPPRLGLPADLHNADAFACYGKGAVPTIISWWTGLFNPVKFFWSGFKSPSHVAFIVSGDESESGVLYESTTLSKLADKYTGVQRQGVQAHDPAVWLNNYPGRVRLYRLKVAMTEGGRTAAIKYAMDAHARQVKYDMGQAIGSGLRTIRNTEDGKRLFCSEFLAFFLQKGEAVSTSINCSEQTPLDAVNLKCYRLIGWIK